VTYTRLQIVRELKKRGWEKKRTLWYATKGHGRRWLGKQGVTLREAASIEMLASSENLDAPRKRK
jgi:hypothetical protein